MEDRFNDYIKDTKSQTKIMNDYIKQRISNKSQESTIMVNKKINIKLIFLNDNS
jgi:hypothetical protein